MSEMGQDDLTGLLGIGAPGEVRATPDGELYEWTQAVDGLGNPSGFWKRLRRRLGRLVRRAVPLARQAAAHVPGAYGPSAPRALRWVPPGLPGLGELYEAPDGSLYEVEEPQPEEAVQGLGQEELQQAMGLGQVGEVRRGPDGVLYQWIEGVDGLGNLVGFWSSLKRFARKRLRPLLRRVLPLVSRVASFVPGYGTAIATGLRTATPFLRRAGLAGGLGELYASADGTVYEVQGVADDQEPGPGQEISAFAEGSAEEALTGPTDPETIEGLEQDEGPDAGATPMGLYVQDSGPRTRWHTPPTEPPALFRPLW